ncbi:hypothetical protein HII36_22620 [Nonomuraea sp. NN258]|uniref:hypothetical protein n=1 Tax=Nonomuraea antri TaxID=2730852 RepID=UPI001569D2FF|nr:hypothetical protein [Nonomuraea antri]NRQ34610.1 hypothetical protein [Nonomuraea antri]
MSEAARQASVWPTVRSIPVSAVTDAKPPGRLRPARPEQVAGSSGTGRDTSGGPRIPASKGAATGVGTRGARPAGVGARANPAAELGFSGDPGQRGDPGDGMLHAQMVWDGTLATNRLDELGVSIERQRVETEGVTVGVGLLVDGWPADVRACVQSVIDHTTAHLLAIDLGNVDGAGDVLADLAGRYQDRISVWHVNEAPHWLGGTATWGESRAKLLMLDDSEVHVLMDTSVVMSGDALTPLVAAVVEGAVAAGWKGAEPSADGLQWFPAGPGKVRALLGDLMAVRRSAALGALPESARYGLNADLELSLALSGDLVVPDVHLPVRELRQHDVAAGYRDHESQRNYDGVLRMLGAS